jgi:copper chaperone
MVESVYAVTGMTCQDCVSSVTEEIGEIPGVRNVDVALDTGQVTVTSDEPVSIDDVRAAVSEAGYEPVTA